MPRVHVPTDAAADSLIRLLAEAARRLRRRIKRDLASGALGSAAYRTTQLGHVDRELRRLRAVARAGAQETVARSYAAGALAADAGMPTPVEVGFSGLHIDAVQLIADAMEGRVDESLVTLGRSIDDVYRRAGLEEAAIKIAAGEDLRTGRLALQRRLEREGDTAFVDRAGRRWRLETYTAMVIRTNTRQALTAGTVNRMLETGSDLITISDHNTETALCKLYEGKTYSLTGDTPGYEIVPALPPFHPNCEHVAHAAAANLDAFEALLDLAMA